MSKDLWNQYMKEMHSSAKKGDWDSAIKYARKVPSDWSPWPQLPQYKIPPHVFDKVLDSVPNDQKNKFHIELASNLHDDLTHEQLDKLHSIAGNNDDVRSKIKQHKNFNKRYPVELGKKAASEFWRSYERAVGAYHFAAVKSAFGDGQPVELTDHRGAKGHSHQGYIQDGRYDPRETSIASRGPTYHYNQFVANLKDILPHLKDYARAVQDKILKDENIEKKIINGKLHILLHRGIGGKYANQILNSAKYDEDNHTVENKTLNIKKASFSSWTTDINVAGYFAGLCATDGYKNKRSFKSQRLIISKWIPIDQVLHSGYHQVHIGQEHAHPSESEIIVHHPNERMKIHTSELRPFSKKKSRHTPAKVIPSTKKLKKSEDLIKDEHETHYVTTKEDVVPLDTPEKELQFLKEEPIINIKDHERIAAATKHSASLDALLERSKSLPDKENEGLLRAIIDNPNAQSHHLQQIIDRFPDSPMLYEMAKHQNLSSEQIYRMLDHPDVVVRRLVLKNKNNFNSGHIDAALKHKDPMMRKLVVERYAHKFNDAQVHHVLEHGDMDSFGSLLLQKPDLTGKHLDAALDRIFSPDDYDKPEKDPVARNSLLMSHYIAKQRSATKEHLDRISKEVAKKVANNGEWGDDERKAMWGVLLNPNHTKLHLEQLLDPSHDIVHMTKYDELVDAIKNSPHFDGKIMDDLAARLKQNLNKLSYKGRALLEHINSLRPYSEDNVNVSLGTHKLRQMRDYVQEKGGKVHKKELEQQGFNLQNLSHLLDAKGHISHDKIQEHIDKQPKTTYGVTHDEWDGMQRHSDDKQHVFQLNYTQEHINKMREAGVLDTFKKINEASRRSGHPVRDNTLGWVRYNLDKDGEVHGGIHIDEIQSDLGTHLVKQIEAQIKAAKESGQISDEQAQTAIQGAANQYPKEDLEKINEILFGGKNPSEVIHEAFKQHMRDKGFHDQYISMFQARPKAKISGQKMDRALPVHMQETYNDQPKKMGYKPAEYGVSSKYGYVAHQNNEEYIGEPTWIDKVRKIEKIDSIFKKLYKNHLDEYLKKEEPKDTKPKLVKIPFKKPTYPENITTSHEEHHAPHYPAGYHFNDDQKKLVQGLTLNSRVPISQGVSTDKYKLRNSSNKVVIMKHGLGIFRGLGMHNEETNELEVGQVHYDVNPAKREVLYHNAAHQLFNLGQFVPTTGIVNIDGHDHSVQEWYEGDVANTRSPQENSKHREIYDQLDQDGTIDKLSIMNVIAGNHDRHSGNFLIHTDQHGKHNIKLIDNGGAFEYPESTSMSGVKGMGDKEYPGYHDYAEQNKPLSKDAADMLHSMSEGKTKEFFQAHGLGEDHPITRNFLARQHAMQQAHKENPQITRHELLRHAILKTLGHIHDDKRFEDIAGTKVDDKAETRKA